MVNRATFHFFEVCHLCFMSRGLKRTGIAAMMVIATICVAVIFLAAGGASVGVIGAEELLQCSRVIESLKDFGRFDVCCW